MSSPELAPPLYNGLGLRWRPLQRKYSAGEAYVNRRIGTLHRNCHDPETFAILMCEPPAPIPSLRAQVPISLDF